MLKAPRPILSFLLSLLSMIFIGLILGLLVWLYRGLPANSYELKMVFIASSVGALGMTLVSYVPLLKIKDEYRFSRNKFRFYEFSDDEVSFFEKKIEALGYAKCLWKEESSIRFMHISFPNLSKYKEKKHLVRHYLELSVLKLGKRNILIVKAWPESALILADWKLVSWIFNKQALNECWEQLSGKE